MLLIVLCGNCLVNELPNSFIMFCVVKSSIYLFKGEFYWFCIFESKYFRKTEAPGKVTDGFAIHMRKKRLFYVFTWEKVKSLRANSVVLFLRDTKVYF